MFRCLVPVFALAAGCALVDDPRPETAAQGREPGQRVYEKNCARCHERGRKGAPIVGDRDAWAARSFLWVAVLEEHAKNGYLDMPPRGGNPHLSDEEVSAAVEYMLMMTHPEQFSE